MARVPFEQPDVLVLGGGGILGEAWMSAVLTGMSEASGFDPRECDGFVGTSAGSIVAAALVAGVDPRSGLGELPEQPAVSDAEAAGAAPEPTLLGRALRIGAEASGGALGSVAAIGLRSTEPGGALVRRAALARVPAGRRSLADLGREVERWGADWDGRLSISALELDSGRRVMFGADDAPEVSVATAVEASCAIPGVFRPIVVGGRRYVDGGVWSPTNMDRAPAGRGTRVLCLNPLASLPPSRALPYGAIGPWARSLAAIEALTLERRGARVTTVGPDADSAAVMGRNLMNGSRRAETIAAGLAQGWALAGGESGRAAAG
ncbi:MAG TPA: patatin-like phospholipase family protein [Thermoleophilaceae bacterium]|nr:patatin-like phospholipase family protein [Thermoleophilaceae bacterium]